MACNLVKYFPSKSEWGKPGKTYLGETEPLKGVGANNNEGEPIVRSVIRPVNLLDVTALGELRKDGHRSISAGGGRPLNDCSHWYLVPLRTPLLLEPALIYSALLSH